MKTKLKVENLQCMNCVATITNKLIKINGIYGVEADIAQQNLLIDHTPDVDFGKVKSELKEIGYLSKTDLDSFSQKAQSWDNRQVIIDRAEKFVNRIKEIVPINKTMSLMDFGCGTGLVGLQFASLVKTLVMVVNSPSMLQVLKSKISDLHLNQFKILEEISDLEHERVDIIVSLMAFHHIVNIETVLLQMFNHLNDGGFIAIADLATEDGDFHKVEVPHYDFDSDELCRKMETVGFKINTCEIFNTENRETVNGFKDFPQFLIIAKK